jgi:gluconate 2-dehydrogenase gamma chain
MEWTEQRLRTLAAAADRIIPPDDFPGAWDNGAGAYFQNIFARELSDHRGEFLGALDALDAEAAARFSGHFHALTDQQKDLLLADVEAGRVVARWPSSPPKAFQLLMELTAEAFYTDPSGGSNRDTISWTMIGYKSET